MTKLNIRLAPFFAACATQKKRHQVLAVKKRKMMNH
jgi:hypothetical protein